MVFWWIIPKVCRTSTLSPFRECATLSLQLLFSTSWPPAYEKPHSTRFSTEKNPKLDRGHLNEWLEIGTLKIANLKTLGTAADGSIIVGFCNQLLHRRKKFEGNVPANRFR